MRFATQSQDVVCKLVLGQSGQGIRLALGNEGDAVIVLAEGVIRVIGDHDVAELLLQFLARILRYFGVIVGLDGKAHQDRPLSTARLADLRQDVRVLRQLDGSRLGISLDLGSLGSRSGDSRQRPRP